MIDKNILNELKKDIIIDDEYYKEAINKIKNDKESRMKNSLKANVVVYHANCMDGLAAATIMRYIIDNVIGSSKTIMIPAEYGKENSIYEIIKNEIKTLEIPTDIYFVDFSPLLNKNFYEMNYNNVYILDHHLSLKDRLKIEEDMNKKLDLDLEDDITIIYDPNSCGAKIVYEVYKDFLDGIINKEIVEYINDRDLWLWKLKNSNEVDRGLRYITKMATDLEAMFDLLFTEKYDIEEIKEIGKILVNYRNMKLDKAVEKATIKKLNLDNGVMEVVMINYCDYASELGNLLSKTFNRPTIVYMIDENGVVRLQIRSLNGEAIKIAKHFDGGGHANAAGASITLDELTKILKS